MDPDKDRQLGARCHVGRGADIDEQTVFFKAGFGQIEACRLWAALAELFGVQHAGPGCRRLGQGKALGTNRRCGIGDASELERAVACRPLNIAQVGSHQAINAAAACNPLRQYQHQDAGQQSVNGAGQLTDLPLNFLEELDHGRSPRTEE